MPRVSSEAEFKAAQAATARFSELLSALGGPYRMSRSAFSDRSVQLGGFEGTVDACDSRLARLTGGAKSKPLSKPLSKPPTFEEWLVALRMIGVRRDQQHLAATWLVSGEGEMPSAALNAETLAWLPTYAPILRYHQVKAKATTKTVRRVAEPRAAVQHEEQRTVVATGTDSSVATTGTTRAGVGVDQVELVVRTTGIVAALERAARESPENLWIKAALKEARELLPRQDSNLKKQSPPNIAKTSLKVLRPNEVR